MPVKNIVLHALRKEIEEQKRLRESAMKQAAAPYDAKIQQLELAIKQQESLLPIGSPEMKFRLISGQVLLAGKRKPGRPRKIIEPSNSYPLNGTTLEKLLFVIREYNRFVTIGEIAEAVKKYQPDLTEADIKDRFGKHMSKYRDKKFLASKQIGSFRNVVYGLPNWLDATGDIMIDHMYKAEELIDKVKTDNGIFSIFN